MKTIVDRKSLSGVPIRFHPLKEYQRYQGRWFKCNLILVHLSATPLGDTVNSGTLRLNLNSLLWYQPTYHYVINLSVNKISGDVV